MTLLEVYDLASRDPSNWDKIPSLHPERKGRLNLSPLKNWVEKRGGLPTYINSIATALFREKYPAWSISRIIATAVNMVKKMCDTGRTMGGRVSVSKAVQSAACTAVAQWERKKAQTTSEAIDDAIIETAEDEPRAQIAQMRKMVREQDKDMPGYLALTDEEYATHVLGIDLGEGVDDLEPEKWLELATEALVPQMNLRLPVFNLSEDAVALGDDEFEKEILRATEINYKGKRVRFTPEMLLAVKQNFDKGVLDYVPFQFVNDQNVHSDDPRLFGGTITKMRVSEDGQKLIARMKLNSTAKQIVNDNPKFGVSVKLHPNYSDPNTGEEYGPLLMHAAGTHYPRLKQLDAWQPVAASVDDPDDTIDLSEATYVTDEPIEEGGDDNMKVKTQNGEVELSEDVIKELAESDAFKSVIAGAVAEKDKEIETLREQNTELSTRIGSVESKSYAQAVEMAVDSYANKGVPKVARDLIGALLLSYSADERDEEIELSVGEGENAEELKLSRWQLGTRILDEFAGFVDLGEEQGSNEDTDVRLSDDEQKKAVDGLVALARANAADAE